MSYPRTKALTRRQVAIVTVWESDTHRERDGWALRVASEALTVTDGQGRDLHYPEGLDPGIPFTDQLSLSGQTMQIEIAWPSDTRNPVDVDLQDGVAEASLLWTSGDGYEAWEQRERRIRGRVTAYRWGNNRETVSITIAEDDPRDAGDWWPPNAEISAAKHADVGTPGGVWDRAHESAGQLPPVVFAPLGSDMLAPTLCVQDAAAGTPGSVDLTPPLYVVSQYRQASQVTSPPVTSEQFVQLYHTDDGRFNAARDSADYRAPILQAYDDVGQVYRYVQGWFTETVGSSSVTITPGSASVTATKIQGKIQVGDFIKAPSDDDTYWTQVDSIEGNTITLVSAYDAGATGVSNGSADVLRRPPSRAYQVYRVCTYGGDGPTGNPISQLVDVLISALSRARLNLPIAISDLESFRPRLAGIDISTVIADRGSPWAWTLERLIEWIPIRPYRREGRIRFAWVGPVREEQIAATIDLDELGPWYRTEPMSWARRPVAGGVRLAYGWSIPRGVTNSTLLLDATRQREGGPLDTWVTTGRAMRAARSWKRGRAEDRTVPVLDVSTDVIAERLSAGLFASWVLYRAASRAQMMRLTIGRELSWAAPGCILRITETGSTRSAAVWRTEIRQVSPIGVGALILEEVQLQG